MNAYQSKRIANEAAIYVFARCEQFIRDYAESAGLSAHELTARVGELIYAQTRGGLLGVANPLSALRGNGTGVGSTLPEMEVARGSRQSAQVKPYRHWTQLPQNRKKMIKHVDAMRLKRIDARRAEMDQEPPKRSQRPYKRTAKQMAAARRNAVLARKAYMAKHGKGK